MQTLVIALLLAGVLGFFAPQAQRGLRLLLESRPASIWAFPFLFTAIFAGAAALAGAFSVKLTLLVLAYTLAPVFCTAGGRLLPPLVSPAGKNNRGRKPTIGGTRDFLAILLLWLPLELAAGASLVPRPAQGFLHSVAYGIAILLALVLFIGYRPLPGMKYNLPRSARDLWLPLAAFALLAPVLAVLGIAVGFIPPPHLSSKPAGAMAGALGVIFAGTALPEEILFRSLIQNIIMLRFGVSGRTLLAAAFIFGCAHLDNGPQPLPNWRYMILATVAGIAYGKVFERASSVTSSAILHTLVDWTKHLFF